MIEPPATRSEPFPSPTGGQGAPLLDEAAFRKNVSRAALRPALLLALLTGTLLALIFYLVRNAEHVEERRSVIANLHAVEKLAVDMETGLRGFQLTKGRLFLEPYLQAEKRLDAQVAALQKHNGSHEGQRLELPKLHAALRAWRDFAAEAMALMNAGQPVDDPAFNARGKALMDEVRAKVANFVQEEERARKARVQTLGWARKALLGAALLGLLAAAPLGWWWLRRMLERIGRAYRASLFGVESQARELAVTVRSIGDAVVSTNAAGEVVLLNLVAEKLLGWSSSEARGRPLTEVFPIFNEETGVAAENPVERVLRERIIVGLANHTILRTRDGRVLPIEDSAAPIISDAGELLGVILVFHDVTDKRERERELAGSERRFRTVFDQQFQFMALLSPTGTLLEINALPLRVAGISRETVLGKVFWETPWWDRLPEMRAAWPERLAVAAQTEGPVLSEDQFNTADGEIRFANASLTAVRDRAGKVEFFIVTAADITERKRTEEALRESEERFRMLAGNMAQLAWIAEEDGHISWYNQRWFDYTGTTLEEMRGLGWQKVNHPDHVERVTAEFLRRARAGEAWEDTFPLRSKDGEYRWFLSRAMPLRDSHRKALRWFGTNTDITAQRELGEELAQAKEQAESASRSKDNFLAALSHELRTPLTPVLMTVAALSEDERLPEEIREQLAVVRRNIELEVRLIDDLLDITRIARGVLPLRPQPCDAHSLIGLAVEIVRNDAQTKGQELTLDLAAKRTGFNSDPARLQQLFWNLFRNAVKFTPPGGRIAVRTRDTATGLLIEVSDNGIGIEADALERIFLPFEQAGLTNDHRFGGLGLGLSIARAIVDLHGGTILVKSSGAGQGATFCISLPNATDPPQGTVGESPENSGAAPSASLPIEPLRLLLVEDHEPTAKVLERLLTRAGHLVVVANTVAAALAAAEHANFDGVISDLGLPDGTGFELMTTLSEKHQLRGIALSGYGMDEDLRRSKTSGFITHLVKPIEFEQLRQALRQLAPATSPES